MTPEQVGLFSGFDKSRCKDCDRRLFDTKEATIIIRCPCCGSDNVFHVVTTDCGNFVVPDGFVYS